MIYIDNRQDKIELDDNILSLIELCSSNALEIEGVTQKFQISILFVDNLEIKEINKQTRNIEKETDVLSFPMLDYEKGKFFKDLYSNKDFEPMFLDGDELVLGDIVLSLEKAKEQSLEFNHSFEREIIYLIIHSILHLLGYDHIEDNDKDIMRSREEEILNKMNIKR